jgi:hypothetical protein
VPARAWGFKSPPPTPDESPGRATEGQLRSEKYSRFGASRLRKLSYGRRRLPSKRQLFGRGRGGATGVGAGRASTNAGTSGSSRSMSKIPRRASGGRSGRRRTRPRGEAYAARIEALGRIQQGRWADPGKVSVGERDLEPNHLRSLYRQLLADGGRGGRPCHGSATSRAGRATLALDGVVDPQSPIDFLFVVKRLFRLLEPTRGRA